MTTIPTSASQLLTKYAEGQRNFHEAVLNQANLYQAHLPFITLDEAVLHKADLRNANLAGANLNHADFSSANMAGINLIGADMIRAKLAGANLTRAFMSGANLSGANLRRADLRNASLAGADLSGADFSGAILENTNLEGATLKGVNFSNTDLDKIDVAGLDLDEAILSEVQHTFWQLKKLQASKTPAAADAYDYSTPANQAPFSTASYGASAEADQAQFFDSGYEPSPQPEYYDPFAAASSRKLPDLEYETPPVPHYEQPSEVGYEPTLAPYDALSPKIGYDQSDGQFSAQPLPEVGDEPTPSPQEFRVDPQEDTALFNCAALNGTNGQASWLDNGQELGDPFDPAIASPFSDPVQPLASDVPLSAEAVAVADWAALPADEAQPPAKPDLSAEPSTALIPKPIGAGSTYLPVVAEPTPLPIVAAPTPLPAVASVLEQHLVPASELEDEVEATQAAYTLEAADAHQATQSTDPRNSKVLQSIQAALLKRVQYSFQQSLLAAYNHQCAMTRCNIHPLLEATFIIARENENADHPSNGLVLRTDLKGLYRLHLIAIDPKTGRILVAPSLQGSDYAQLHGRKAHLPTHREKQPDPALLAEHLQACKWYQSAAKPSLWTSIRSRLPAPMLSWSRTPRQLAIGAGIATCVTLAGVLGIGQLLSPRGAEVSNAAKPEPTATASPTAQSSQAAPPIQIRVGSVTYGQPGMIRDNAAYIPVALVPQLGLDPSAIAEPQLLQHQGDRYVKVTDLQALGATSQWDGTSRTMSFTPVRKIDIQPINVDVNQQPYTSTGLAINGVAYLPISLLDQIQVSGAQIQAGDRVEYENQAYFKATQLQNFRIALNWNAGSRTLSLSPKP